MSADRHRNGVLDERCGRSANGKDLRWPADERARHDDAGRRGQSAVLPMAVADFDAHIVEDTGSRDTVVADLHAMATLDSRECLLSEVGSAHPAAAIDVVEEVVADHECVDLVRSEVH